MRPMTTSASLDQLCINSIRAISIDAVQKANSGHPGLPMGAAPMAVALWNRHLRHNPKNPNWFNRDRFILSAGHGSMLLYSLLYLTGYELSLDQIKNFRQLHSQTPGHPENFMTKGVEMATGPLGQGLGHSVGFAIAEKWLAATFNRPDYEVVDHHTYVLVSDGDLQEGLSSEAASLAGHLGLGKLIALYDDNDVTLDGPANLSWSEDVEMRFKAFGWQVLRVDGMDVDAVDRAIQEAQKDTGRPSLIMAKTIIGFGSPNKAGTFKAHGSPLGPDEVKLTKENLGIPLEPEFWHPDEAVAEFRKAIDAGEALERAWRDKLIAYKADYPEEGKALEQAIAGKLPEGWLSSLPAFSSEDKQATRQASGKVINAIASVIPTLIGGSADLSESTMTTQKGSDIMSRELPSGRNVYFGIREHAMIAAVNGMNLHGGVKAYGGSFFCFTDYCRPSIRLAALQQMPSIFVFTHDSVGLGEDGPTHQPIEHLTSLRAIPNLNVVRPADGNETAAAWKLALESTHTPTLLVLTRQSLPTVSPDNVQDHPAERGAYILKDGSSDPKVVLVATGSEVSLALEAAKTLEAQGTATRVVSMPSWHLFDAQPAEYREAVLPKHVRKVSVEAGSTLAWRRYADVCVGIDRFGVSAPGPEAMEALGMTVENVVRAALGD